MSGPVVGLAKAAELCGVSVATIRRRREILVSLGAIPSSKGWEIPISALITSGLMPNVTPSEGVSQVIPSATPVTSDGTPTVSPSATPVSELEDKVDALEKALIETRQRLEISEAVMAEKERVIQAQALALALIEGPSASGRVNHAPKKTRGFWRTLVSGKDRTKT